MSNGLILGGDEEEKGIERGLLYNAIRPAFHVIGFQCSSDSGDVIAVLTH